MLLGFVSAAQLEKNAHKAKVNGRCVCPIALQDSSLIVIVWQRYMLTLQCTHLVQGI